MVNYGYPYLVVVLLSAKIGSYLKQKCMLNKFNKPKMFPD